MAFLESLKSAQVFAQANDAVAPGKVTGLAYTVEQGKVLLSWDALTVNADDSALTDLASYRVFRKSDMADSFLQIGTVDGSETTFTDSSMKDGATYFYAVAAFDDEPTPNEGEKSADLEVKTIPSIPVGLKATAFDGMIRLDWTSVQEEADVKLNENLNGYNIYRSETDGSGYEKIGTAAKAETSFEDSSAVNGTTYYYVITAIDNSL